MNDSHVLSHNKNRSTRCRQNRGKHAAGLGRQHVLADEPDVGTDDFYPDEASVKSARQWLRIARTRPLLKPEDGGDIGKIRLRFPPKNFDEVPPTSLVEREQTRLPFLEILS